MSHAQGKLSIEIKNVAIADTGDYEGIINVKDASGKLVFQIWGDEESDELRARRLVACWNYCIGMSTEHLEAGDDWKVEAREFMNQGEMVEAVKHCRAMTGWDLKKALDEVKLLQSGHQKGNDHAK